MSMLGKNTKFASHGENSLKDFTIRCGAKAAAFRLQAIAREITPDERVRICWRHRLPDTPHLTLVHLPANGDEKPRGFVRGLMKCSSVWVCAVCSSRISHQRKIDLLDAVNRNRENLLAIHVTYTASHGKRDALASTLAGLTEAYRRLRSGRWWQGFKEHFGVRASVRATEITYGENGWHPHFHELLFVRVGIGLENAEQLEKFAAEIEMRLAQKWIEVLNVENLSASEEHGLTVTAHAGDVAGYIAKYGHLPEARADEWTVAHEITMQQVKKTGGLHGRQPWELLWDAQTDRSAAALWKEYVSATKGRSQLQWSRGAKELLGVDLKSDDEIAAADESADAEILALITPAQWDVFDRHGVIHHLLDFASARDMPKIERMIATADAEIAAKSAPIDAVVCLPCSAEYSERIYFQPDGDRSVCPKCGKVSILSRPNL